MLRRICALIVLVALFVETQRAAAQLDQLVLRVPSAANALVIVNAQSLHAHIQSVGDDWEGAGQTAPLAGVQWYLQAAELDYEFMQPLWEVSVSALPQAPTMEQIAAASGGRADRLAGSVTVERPNDSYVVAFGPRVLAVMSPANRQQVARWIREAKTRKAPALSPFLTDAVRIADAGPAQIIVAFDLGGVLAPEEIEHALAKSPALTAAGVDPNGAAELLGNLSGLRLNIQWRDDAFHGELVVEFSQSPAALAKVAQPLLLEILAKRGANVGALEQWTSSVRGNAIVLEGVMTSSGLRRVASILSSPVGPASAAPAPSAQTVSPESVTGAASQAYFRAVTGYLDDLFGGNIRPQSLYQIQVWVDRYARQIQDLNTQNVDPDVLAYTSNVIVLLGEIGSEMQRAQMRSDIRESTVDGPGFNRYGRYGAYGYFEKGYVARDIALAQADEASQGLAAMQQIVGELHQLSDQTRQAMSQRYGIQF